MNIKIEKISNTKYNFVLAFNLNLEKGVFLAGSESYPNRLLQNFFQKDGILQIEVKDNSFVIVFDNEQSFENLKSPLVTFFVNHENDIKMKEERVFDSSSLSKEEQEELEQMQTIIGEQVLPFLEQDGGGIDIKGYESRKLYVKLTGACDGCPSVNITLKNGIENMLKYYVPNLQEVINIEE